MSLGGGGARYSQPPSHHGRGICVLVYTLGTYVQGSQDGLVDLLETVRTWTIGAVVFCSWSSVPCCNQGKAALALTTGFAWGLDQILVPFLKAPQRLLAGAVHRPREQVRHEMGKWNPCLSPSGEAFSACPMPLPRLRCLSHESCNSFQTGLAALIWGAGHKSLLDAQSIILFFFFFNLFIYLFLAALGLCCCTKAFSS